jgi:glycosyltransferase involved in cell wall biosynthesis
MPKIVYLVTEDWFFVSHFLPMARTARDAGFEVVIAARIQQHGDRLAAEGFRVIPLEIERRSLGLREGFRNFLQAWRIGRTERPDIVHCIALRSVVLGGLAAKFSGAKSLVLAPTGLGLLWTEKGAAVRLARGLVRSIVGRWLRGPRTHYLFENRDDAGEFRLDADGADVTVVPGAGVDPTEFPRTHEPPAPPVRIAVVARMIGPKGIAEAVAAAIRARELGAPIELHLFGGVDTSDRRAIPEATLRAWSAQAGIHWHGHAADVAKVWREHHVALFLSSYREGLPRTLVEAAASGRPIVTTDAPGCRDVVRDGQEGFLVPVGDIEAAARALVALAGDADLRARLGAAANARFHERLTEAAITRAVGRVYRSLVQQHS